MIILEKIKITIKILSKNIEIKIIFMKMIINFKEVQVKRAQNHKIFKINNNFNNNGIIFYQIYI